jgi:hypothetical protein
MFQQSDVRSEGAVDRACLQLTDQTHLLTFFSSLINRDGKLQIVGFVTKDSTYSRVPWRTYFIAGTLSPLDLQQLGQTAFVLSRYRTLTAPLLLFLPYVTLF